MRRIDVRDWRSPVARQFSIQSLPHLVVYNPDGQIVKQGYDPAMLDDPTSASGGSNFVGESGVMMMGAGIIAVVALLLFVVTKAFGPQKKAS